MLVALINAYMDEKTQENRDNVEEHITPMDDESRNEIEDILDGIENGDYKTHFNTDSLQHARKTIRTERKELKLRRWSADHGSNGNAIVEAYDLYLPGVGLNDNPKLKNKITQIEKDQNLGFFETADFEDGLLAFFSSLR